MNVVISCAEEGRLKQAGAKFTASPSQRVHNSWDSEGLTASVGVSFRTVLLIFTNYGFMGNLKEIRQFYVLLVELCFPGMPSGL